MASNYTIWLSYEHRIFFGKEGKPFLNVETTEGYPSCVQINAHSAHSSIDIQTSVSFRTNTHDLHP